MGGQVAFSFIEKVLSSSKKVNDKQIISGKGLPLSSKLITFSDYVSKVEFEEWVKDLPDTVYRMKGYVPISGYKNPFLFQYAYGMVNWMPEYVKMEPRLVIIGEGIDKLNYEAVNPFSDEK